MATVTALDSRKKKASAETQDKPAEAPARRVIRNLSPADGEALPEVAITTPDEVKGAVARAKRAQAAWARMPLEERAERVLRFRDALVENADRLVDILVRETGKPRNEALLHEVLVVADLASYFAHNAARILAPQPISLHFLVHRASYVHYAPKGVVGVISPWNFPFAIPMGDVIPALLAGNAVVVKPSEVTPLIALEAKRIYDSTGLPEDLFQVVAGDGATGQALIESGIQKLIFTGGVATGKRVAAACGAQLVPCIMELGGKAPLLALSDCDVERTARAIVYGGFCNSGQACISVERVYAHRSIHDALLRRVKELVGDLKQGDATKNYVDVGSIIFGKQMEVAEKLIADAVSKGAEVVAGGERVHRAGNYFQPTVLAECHHGMDVMREEIFGPIVPIQRIDSDDEGIALANDSHLGLNAYVFSRSRERALRVAEKIEAGSVVVNDVMLNYGACETPFGGLKESGFGRVHGDDSLREMCDKRHVNYGRIPMPSRDPLWFPYSQTSYTIFSKGLEVLFHGAGLVQRIVKKIP
jgi:succinate-semialdehyde dehydrogenase/glutarate-semialdehyde dehydrogenase